ncbi:hypothetical protein EK21DRAFT_115315 [Setomelanomma holmii]|uniref:Uncharacterized protein n=1 Tax=Setomelanomma holmii TaxID=210430 RepID=A0A9P4LJT4_9PLEO|nr:hypothetical protein EK21DRAFT_115315 [Setomelanomma holmii]
MPIHRHTFDVKMTDDFPKTYQGFEARPWREEPLLYVAFALPTLIRNAIVTIYTIPLFSMTYDAVRDPRRRGRRGCVTPYIVWVR